MLDIIEIMLSIRSTWYSCKILEVLVTRNVPLWLQPGMQPNHTFQWWDEAREGHCVRPAPVLKKKIIKIDSILAKIENKMCYNMLSDNTEQ